MFVKKLLSVVSTLFIGSQLLSFANANPTPLTGCNTLTLTNDESLITNGCTFGETSYCLSGNSIYGYTSVAGNTATCIINKEGTYVLLGDAKLGESATVSDDVNNLKIYQCTGVSTIKCKQTFGYVLNNNQYLEISASGTNRIRTDGAAITTLADLGVTDCSVGEIYNDNKGDADSSNDVIKLCLVGGATDIYSQGIAETTIKSYVLNNVQDNVFTNVAGGSGDKDKPIIVNVGNGKIILSTSGYDYCANENSEVIETFNGFCSETPGNDPCSDNPYECADTGICKREESSEGGCSIVIGGASSGCTSGGYYLINNEANSTYEPIETGSSYLVKCSSPTECVVVPNDGTFKVGYYKYADKENKYIKCEEYGDCSVISVHTLATGCNEETEPDTPDYAIGDIINNSSNDILCLDNTIADGIVLGTSAEYFAGETSIFTNTPGKYVKIEAGTDNSVVLSTPGKVDETKSYLYTDTTYKIHVKTSKAAICSAATIVEFKLDKTTSEDNTLIVYDKHAEHEFSE